MSDLGHVLSTVAVILLLCLSASAQSIVSVQPDSAKRGEYLEVTITGQNTHFEANSGTIIVQFTQNSSTMSMAASILSLTQLQGTLHVPATTPLGIWNTLVEDFIDPVMFLPGSFHVYTDQPPSIASISRSVAFQQDSIHITVTCANTNFSPGLSASVSLTQGALTIYAVNEVVNNPISIAADIKIPDWAVGVWSLNVSAPGIPVLTLPDCFSVYLPNAHIVAIEPNTAIPGHVVPVTIDFANTSFIVGGPEIRAYFVRPTSQFFASLTPTTSTQLQGNLDIPGDMSWGAYHVHVNDDIHPLMTLLNGFTLIPDPTPVLTTIQPAEASLGDTVTVTIAGHNNVFFAFPGLISLVEGVATIPAISINVFNLDSLEATFAIPLDAAQAFWDIQVSSPVQPTVNYPDRFQIHGPSAITGITPSQAGQGSVVQLTVDCQNVHFAVPAYYSPIIFSHGADTILATASPTSQTSLLTYLVVPAEAEAGLWDVTVRCDSTTYLTMTEGLRIFSSCGDFDGTRQIDVSDAVSIVNYIFAGGAIPVDQFQGDINCSDQVDVTDVVYLLNYIFAAGASPCSSCR